MKAITIRGIDTEISSRLKQIAEEEKKSVNQLVVEMIRQYTGMKKEKRHTKIHHDLDHLFGRWTNAEFNKIQSILDSQREIDPELWK